MYAFFLPKHIPAHFRSIHPNLALKTHPLVSNQQVPGQGMLCGFVQFNLVCICTFVYAKLADRFVFYVSMITVGPSYGSTTASPTTS